MFNTTYLIRKRKNNTPSHKSIIARMQKYLPKLLHKFEELTDTRNQSYVTYSMKTICVTRLFGLLCGFNFFK